MFDYDFRPVTPQVVLVGSRASTGAYAIRDFLTRNGRPYDWVDLDQEPADERTALWAGTDPSRLPLCVLPDGTELECATVERVALGLGMMAAPRLGEYDLAIIGAGPAGLAAAVYAASEGLRTAVVEAVAPGGQAGTTSMIENYLGFPGGISGSQLASRATTQAEQFGAEILLARHLEDLTPEAGLYVSRLSDGSVISSRSLLVATGVEWRRLDVPGVERLLGAGVYYGAGPSEAPGCRGAGVAIIGGGNSAGQACVRFSRYADHVTLLVRGASLGASMSQYLIDKIATTDNIEVRTGTQVVGVDGDARLRTVGVVSTGSDTVEELPAAALFICIGGTPRTEAAESLSLVHDRSGYLMTGTDLAAGGVAPPGWPLARQPFPLETNLPGLFAAGDVRSGSVKRCAAATGEGAMAVALVHRRLAELGGGVMETLTSTARLTPNPEFAELASDERIEAAALALRANGIDAEVVPTGEEARRRVDEMLPDGAEVFNNSSRTLEAIGVAEDIERSGRYQPIRLVLYQMDREMQAREMRKLAAAPDYVVGSAHAVTEQGSLLVASASGSQLGPLASGAGRVILVVGGQKIVPDLETGLRRIREYCYPLENERALKAYGVPSGVNNVLIINRALAAGRVTAILVRERLGF